MSAPASCALLPSSVIPAGILTRSRPEFDSSVSPCLIASDAGILFAKRAAIGRSACGSREDRWRQTERLTDVGVLPVAPTIQRKFGQGWRLEPSESALPLPVTMSVHQPAATTVR